MIIKDNLSFKISLGLIIIYWSNFSFMMLVILSIIFDLVALVIIYIIPFCLFFLSNVFLIIYSIKKIINYATIGLTLGVVSHILSLYFYLGFTLINISLFITIINILMLCLIILALTLNLIIYRRREKNTASSELKIKFSHFHPSKTFLKILLMLGILLVVISIIVPIILGQYSMYKRLEAERFVSNFMFDQVLFLYFYLTVYEPAREFNQKMSLLKGIFYFLVLVGIIIIINSIAFLKSDSKKTN